VRQYVNLIRRAALLQMKLAEVIETERQRDRSARQTQTNLSTSEHQALDLFLPTTPEQIKPEADIRRAYLRHVLQVCENNITRAARALGISVNTLRKWVG
jgi:DNA-binding NtrC family response regulator